MCIQQERQCVVSQHGAVNGDPHAPNSVIYSAHLLPHQAMHAARPSSILTSHTVLQSQMLPAQCPSACMLQAPSGALKTSSKQAALAEVCQRPRRLYRYLCAKTPSGSASRTAGRHSAICGPNTCSHTNC